MYGQSLCGEKLLGTNFQIPCGRCKPALHYAWMQFRPGVGLAFPLLQALLIQPDPPARMGVWYENRAGKVGYEWDRAGTLMVMLGGDDY